MEEYLEGRVDDGGMTIEGKEDEDDGGMEEGLKEDRWREMKGWLQDGRMKRQKEG